MTTDAITLREERPADRAVNVAAFGVPAEADLVERLHAGGDVQLSLVAVAEGRVVGHILFSRLPVEMGETVVPAAALAPLAVLPAWQRRGIGSELIRQGLRQCGERGIPAVVVLGDPAYYGRFGFRREAARGLRSPWSGPHLMAIELTPGALGAGAGIARYPTAFMALEARSPCL